jgi:hypothetical protein
MRDFFAEWLKSVPYVIFYIFAPPFFACESRAFDQDYAG